MAFLNSIFRAVIKTSKVKVESSQILEHLFFKATDYGVVGDAFAVAPELIKKLKEFKSTQ